MAPSRNAACPCGSGLKYKRCCALADQADLGDPTLATAEVRRAGLALGIGLISGSVALGIGVGTLREAVADGIAVSLALCLVSVIYLMARNPPTGTGRGGGTAINYGMDGSGRRRSAPPASRRSRRRR